MIKSFEMNELALIIDLHRNSDRQGPGSVAETLRAFDVLNYPPERVIKVADIGCGSGDQTLTLARRIDGQITAVDMVPQFLNDLDERSRILGLDDKIVTLNASMDDLPFAREEYDLIWSEGAIYNMGFENGIRSWRNYLKKGGCLAVTEITWMKSDRPKEIEEFWTSLYPEIDTASNKIRLLEYYGFTLLDYFTLKPDSWLVNYYKPIQKRFEDFLARNNQSDLAKKIVEEYEREIELYTRYQDVYNYGFYIAKKN
jgi:ubiquinone/menaquinone biosynthesis C-methylase UbiE